MKKLLSLLLALALLLSFCACSEPAYGEDYLSASVPVVTETEIDADSTATPTDDPTLAPTQAQTETPIFKYGEYYSAEDVALYIHTYGCLPLNFITKQEARSYGWSGGSVEDYVRGAAIGGDRFYNREGLLPDADGREYYECDIDTLGRGSRGAKRIVFSNDGLIYYTEDHYASFTLLYGEE